MPARKNTAAVAIDATTDNQETTVTETTPTEATVTETTETTTEAAPIEISVTESMRINLHVLIDVDPSKWSIEQSSEEADAARAALVKVLMAGGYDEATAIETANKVHKPATAATGPVAVRESVKDYMLAEMRKLARIAEAGAEINYYVRPNAEG
jgi:hypothetical protein